MMVRSISVKSISENNLILHLKFSKKQILSQKYQFAITFDIKLAKISKSSIITKLLY